MNTISGISTIPGYSNETRILSVSGLEGKILENPIVATRPGLTLADRLWTPKNIWQGLDLDGDGIPDMFLAQSFLSRMDWSVDSQPDFDRLAARLAGKIPGLNVSGPDEVFLSGSVLSIEGPDSEYVEEGPAYVLSGSDIVMTANGPAPRPGAVPKKVTIRRQSPQNKAIESVLDAADAIDRQPVALWASIAAGATLNLAFQVTKEGPFKYWVTLADTAAGVAVGTPTIDASDVQVGGRSATVGANAAGFLVGTVWPEMIMRLPPKSYTQSSTFAAALANQDAVNPTRINVMLTNYLSPGFAGYIL